MTLFVDSSGMLALIDQNDAAHAGVVEAFALGRAEALTTHTYVVIETLAVARRCFGPAAAADLIDRVLPALDVIQVDAELHTTALADFRDTYRAVRLAGGPDELCIHASARHRACYRP